MAALAPETNRPALRVVLFSGGRGSGALAELVATDARVALTVAINGYDDGASTGEVRRFLGDALGPSDFRKNAARYARLRQTCHPALIDLLDQRFPQTATPAALTALADTIEAGSADCSVDAHPLAADIREALVRRLRRIEAESGKTGRTMNYGNASVGNIVFAGGFLECGRRFNAAIEDYCALMGLPAGLIENVTDGTNAFLVALDCDGHVLGSEEAIVDAKHHNTIREIFLIDRALDTGACERLAAQAPQARRDALESWAIRPALNARLAARLAEADLIIYAPGTQHSSLFPSYLTPGLGAAVADNLRAIKLLVTNIQEDAEIAGQSAVDLIDRAVFYLRDKDRLSIPTPCLITHYLLNDPGRPGDETTYVPLGRLESLEDPRLVRVGNYEAGSSGRHDASKVLTPYIRGFIAREQTVQRVAVVLSETSSSNKIAQTLLEMVRGGVCDLPVEITVFHSSGTELDRGFLERLPFAVRALESADPRAQDREFRAILSAGDHDFVVFFDSSGMYNGEDIAGLASHLTLGRLDAVWGSRRLSLRDIQESYRLRYRGNAVRGAVSAVGSHVLSLQFLALFGRYVADTLSGARIVRASDVLATPCLISDRHLNQYLLSALLRRRAEMMEIPVQFFAISPDQVRRTSVTDGIRAMIIAVGQRFGRPPSDSLEQ